MNAGNEILAFRINDFCRVMGIGRTTTYRLISEGKIRSITIAGRTLIPKTECDRLLSQETEAA